MNVLLPLAGMFAAVVLVGTAAVYLHDLLARRPLDHGIGGHGGGRGTPPGRRGQARFPERRSAARGGQVVWVRAGSYASDGSGTDQRGLEPRPTAVIAERGTLR